MSTSSSPMPPSQEKNASYSQSPPMSPDLTPQTRCTQQNHSRPPSPPPPPSLKSPSSKASELPAPSIQSLPTQNAEKRTGKRIVLLLIALLSATFILSFSWRHICRVSLPHSQKFLAKRMPQTSKLASPTQTAAASSPISNTPTATVTSSDPSAPPTIPTAAPTLPTPLPQPFDLTLASNFSTQSCQAFFNDFTQQEDFRQCRSFAFLLGTSSAFIEAQRDFSRFNTILWATCNTPRAADDCAHIMSGYLSRLNSACRTDLNNQIQMVVEAQIGFQSYVAMRKAACLEDPTSHTYCYMEAVAASTPADVYFYALPLGTAVPPKTKPSCSPCVKNVLAVYSQYVSTSPGSASIQAPSGTGNSTFQTTPSSPLPALSKVYSPAAKLAVSQCGGQYANVGIAVSGSGAVVAPGFINPWQFILLALAVFVAF